MSELKVESLSSQGDTLIIVEGDLIRFSTKAVMIEIKITEWPEIKHWIDWKVENISEPDDDEFCNRNIK